jgi:hypothetical protein
MLAPAKRNILEYCLENRRIDPKYIALDLRGVMKGVPNFQIILQLAPHYRILSNERMALSCLDAARGSRIFCCVAIVVGAVMSPAFFAGII